MNKQPFAKPYDELDLPEELLEAIELAAQEVEELQDLLIAFSIAAAESVRLPARQSEELVH